jgi:predicted nucleic acid-binding Zn ribbon protein
MKPKYSRQSDARHRAPQKASDIVAQLMAARGYARVQSAAVTRDAWNIAAGEKMSTHTTPGSLKRGVLEVLVRNSAVLQELTFQKKKILKKLVAALPDAKIEDLKFRVAVVD